MSIQAKRSSFKFQPKSLHPSRPSLPSRHQNQYSLKQRTLINYAPYTQTNGSNQGTINSAKLKLQSKQQYLRPQPSQKNYQNQIEKLTQICQQFYKENQSLKTQLKQQTHKDSQIWNKKVQQLQDQLHKYKQVFQQQRKRAQQQNTTSKSSKKSITKQNINSNGEHASHKIIITSKNNLQSSNDSAKIQKLMAELQARQNQLMKYMHKQTQFIQIYVQKQQLQHQVRNLYNMVQQQNKQIQDYKRNEKKFLQMSFDGRQKFETSFEMEDNGNLVKIQQYNQKLIQKLKVSHHQIERLNSILKVKVQQVQDSKKIVQTQQQQIIKLNEAINIVNNKIQQIQSTQKQIKTECLQCKNKDKKKQEVQQNLKLMQKIVKQKTKIEAYLHSKIQQLQQQNVNLLSRIDDQVQASLKLRDIITKLQQDKIRKNINSYEMKQIQTATQFSEQFQQRQIETQQKFIQTEQDFFIEPMGGAYIEKLTYQIDMQAYEDRIRSLKQQNQQLSKFIMQQSKHISDIKNQNYSLNRQNAQYKLSVQRLQSHQRQLPELIKKIRLFQQKLELVTGEYQKLLTEVQNSCNQSESVHKQIGQVLENRLDELSQDYPQDCSIRMYSQMLSKSRFKMNEKNLEEQFQISPTKLKMKKNNNISQSKMKDQKSLSLSELITKN